MKRCAGFSLVEVLCAILILGIGLAGMAHGITTALRSTKESERQTAAALLAAGQIETVRAEGYLVGGAEEGTGSGPLSQYRWVQRITESDIEGLFEVEVSVRHGTSEETIYKLQTMLFDPPLLSRRDDTGNRGRNRERRGR
jgi:prepilin-type N-terminal cleavage/methylation domain-containing protein